MWNSAMSAEAVCRVCLGGGVRMDTVEDDQLLALYEKLASAKVGHPSFLFSSFFLSTAIEGYCGIGDHLNK